MDLIRVIIQKYAEKRKDYFNRYTFRNIIVFTGGIIIFIGGVIIYGIIINMKEVKLEDAMAAKGLEVIVSPSIVIERKSYQLHLYEDTVLVKSYRASFGRDIHNAKSSDKDLATPVGEYKICELDSVHKYQRFLKINYPNMKDAMEGLRKGRISQNEYDKLKYEFYYEECLKTETELGINMGIHGIGEYNVFFKNLPFVFNWTNGTIAVSNEDIEELFSIVKKGTKIVIH